jgi:hypothetical protein
LVALRCQTGSSGVMRADITKASKSGSCPVGGYDWDLNLRATDHPEFDAWRWDDYWCRLTRRG